MSDHQKKIDTFITHFASATGTKAALAPTTTDIGRANYLIPVELEAPAIDLHLFTYVGKLFQDGQIMLKDITVADDMDIHYGAQILYEIPIEEYRTDYLTQAFYELKKFMATGQRGSAELIDNEAVFGMRIARSLSMKFLENRSVFAKNGAGFGTQATRDLRKLITYAAMPL